MTSPRALVALVLTETAAEVQDPALAGLVASAARSLAAEDADDYAAAEVEGVRWAVCLSYDLGPDLSARLAAIAAHDPASPAAEVWTELAATLDRWTETAAGERLRHRITCELATYTSATT